MPAPALPNPWGFAPVPAATAVEPLLPRAILLLEDDDAVAGLITMILRRLGRTVIRARSCIEGLKCFRADGARLELAIIDAGLPDGDGIAIGRRLRELAPDLRVLITSGKDRSHFAGWGADARCGYLPKPFNPAEVEQAVGLLLGGSY